MVPVAVARVCAWTWMCVPGRAPDIHPTTAGHGMIAAAVLRQVRDGPPPRTGVVVG
jgi:hypothetical protein